MNKKERVKSLGDKISSEIRNTRYERRSFMFKKLFSTKENIIKFTFFLFLSYACIYLGKYALQGPKILKYPIALIVIAIAYFALTRPHKFFYLFVFVLPFINFPKFTRIDVVNIANVLALLLIFAVLAHGVIKGKIKIFRSYLNLPIMALFGIMSFSIIQTRNITQINYIIKQSWFNLPYNRTIFQILIFLLMVLIFYMSCNFLNNKERLFKSIKIWLYSSVVVSCLGIYGFMGKFVRLPFSWNFVSQMNLRASSTLKEPIFLGLYLMTTLPLLFSLAINKVKIIPRRQIYLFLMLQVIVLLLSAARGAWVGFLIALMVILLFSSGNIFRSIKITLLITVILFVGIWAINSVMPITERFVGIFTGADLSTLARLDTLLAAANMFKAYPWLGVGYGNYYFRFLEFAPPFHDIIFAWTKGVWHFPDAHNLFLNFLAETGVVGFLIISWFFISLLINLYRSIKLSKNTIWFPYLIGLFGNLIGILIVYQFVSILNLAFIWVMFAIIISIQRILLEEKHKIN